MSANSIYVAFRGTVVAADVITLVALVGLAVVVARDSIFKHHSDVARRGFLFFKIALWISALVYLLMLGDAAWSLAGSIVNGRGPRYNLHIERLFTVNLWFNIVSLAVMMSCIARLIIGTKMVVKNQGAKAYLIIIDIAAAIVALLAFVAMILRQLTTPYYYLSEPSISLIFSNNVLHLAVAGLLIIGGILNVIFSWIEHHRTRKEAGGMFRSLGTYVAAIATTQLVVFVFSFVGSLVVTAFSRNLLAWMFIELFIQRIGTVVVFFLILKLGKKQENGLWLMSGAGGLGEPKASNEISVDQV